jgi:cyanuric acid amidohydrolase
MREAKVHRIATRGPDDVSGLLAAIDAGTIDPAGIVAVLGKTEGNGCVNDFTRAFAVAALKTALSAYLPAARLDAIAYVMSGGTEGALSPHLVVLERNAAERGESPSLAIGTAQTAALAPEELGRAAQAGMVADAVAAAMADAGIVDPADVHFVQIKCPLLTAERIAEAETRGRTVATRDTLNSMSLSRGAAALGVALALGEIEAVADEIVCRDRDAWSSRASTSAGVELQNHEIVVLGMSAEWSGPLAIDHAVMADAIDTDSVREALIRLGFGMDGQMAKEERPRLAALLAKAEPGTAGRLRGARHTMLDDSDIAATRHARAFVGGALASLVGTADLFVSGGAEHQGPDGGGPVAIIAKRESVAA